MRRRRRRSQRRGSRWPSRRTLTVVLVLIITAGTVITSSAVQTGSLRRSISTDLVTDSNARLGINRPPFICTNRGTGSTLVTITNRFARSVTVTVTVQGDSTPITFTLASGASRAVSYAVSPSYKNPTVTYGIVAAATGLRVSAPNRQTTVNFDSKCRQ